MPVAQQDRAAVSEAAGREFDPPRARIIYKKPWRGRTPGSKFKNVSGKQPKTSPRARIIYKNHGVVELQGANLKMFRASSPKRPRLRTERHPELVSGSHRLDLTKRSFVKNEFH